MPTYVHGKSVLEKVISTRTSMLDEKFIFMHVTLEPEYLDCVTHVFLHLRSHVFQAHTPGTMFPSKSLSN